MLVDKMDSGILVVSAVVGITLVIGLLVILLTSKKGKTDSMEMKGKTFFCVGLMWLIVGLSLTNSGLWLLGFVFLMLGLANKAGWKEEKKAKPISKAERRVEYLVAAVLVLVVLLGIITFFSMA